MTVTVATLGFPRIGPRRELKTALENHWSGKIDAKVLLTAAADLRAQTWKRQRDVGATVIPSNDFSLFNHVLDTTATVDAVSAIYGWTDQQVDLKTYFAMARSAHGGVDAAACEHGHAHAGEGASAAEMTKWFDTNYHYLVPEFTADQKFRLASTKIADEFLEAKALGIETRPVLGPVTYLLLGKARGEDFDPLTLLPRLLPVYAEILRALASAGATWIQIDEPCLVMDLSDTARAAFGHAYGQLAKASPAHLMLTTYLGALADNLNTALAPPVHGIHVDLVRAPEQLDDVLAGARPDLVLSLGVIDGRNIWKADLNTILDRIEPIVASGRSVIVSPSCSLLHTPIDLARENALDPEVKDWLAFAVQKVAELSVLAKALNDGRASVRHALDAALASVESRRTSGKIDDPAVKARVEATDPSLARRSSAFEIRRKVQRDKLNLPPYPTTTIGSFPQTPEIREARADHGKGAINDAAYDESVGLDVLVHGEFERNDMVEYFGEQLSGFAFTNYAWVQSYGSLCVRPARVARA
jgi:5-methyltetrahydropteroyltriglutamate--homocysteine methyltransferase